MLAAVLLFAFNSAAGKWLVAKYSVGEFLLIRSTMTLILLLPLIWRAGCACSRMRQGPVCSSCASCCPRSRSRCSSGRSATCRSPTRPRSILAGPIYVTALSVLLLGERVGWRRWAAVLVRILRRSDRAAAFCRDVTLSALIALGGSMIYALLMITTRMLRETDQTVLMTTQLIGILLFAAVMAPFGWVAPAAPDLMLLAGIAVLQVVSLFCSVRSLQLADASVVAPYQYSLILWSVLFGWQVFGEVPDAYTMIGAAIIVAAGLYIFWRERAVRSVPGRA